MCMYITGRNHTHNEEEKAIFKINFNNRPNMATFNFKRL
jgi:hypothetical protein